MRFPLHVALPLSPENLRPSCCAPPLPILPSSLSLSLPREARMMEGLTIPPPFVWNREQHLRRQDEALKKLHEACRKGRSDDVTAALKDESCPGINARDPGMLTTPPAWYSCTHRSIAHPDPCRMRLDGASLCRHPRQCGRDKGVEPPLLHRVAPPHPQPLLHRPGRRSLPAAADSSGGTQVVLDLKGDVTCVDTPYGQTPLHIAAKYGHAEACRLLVLSGADPGALNGANKTPIQVGVTPRASTPASKCTRGRVLRRVGRGACVVPGGRGSGSV